MKRLWRRSRTNPNAIPSPATPVSQRNKMESENDGAMSLGFSMPPGFDIITYDRVRELAGQKGEPYSEPWRHFAAAWTAVAYRFLAAAESDEAFRQAWPVSTHERIYLYNRPLFNFLANAVSCVECFFHAVYAVATTVETDPPPFSDASLRLFPTQVVKELRKSFPADPLVAAMDSLLHSVDYKMIDEFRQILFHRGVPPRLIKFSPDRPPAGTTTIPINPKSRSSEWEFDFEVTPDLTASRLDWLSKQLSQLFRLTESFCIDHP